MTKEDDDFQYWLFYMRDELDILLETLPKDVASQLDFSLESLKVLEKCILENFNSLEEMVNRKNVSILDRLARYLGETIRKSAGGEWGIQFTDPTDVYYHKPTISHKKYGTVCPLTLVTACTDRRKGTYLFDVATALKEWDKKSLKHT